MTWYMKLDIYFRGVQHTNAANDLKPEQVTTTIKLILKKQQVDWGNTNPLFKAIPAILYHIQGIMTKSIINLNLEYYTPT